MRSPTTRPGPTSSDEDPRHAVVGHHPVGDVLHGDGRERRGLGGLPDDRIAAHRGNRRVPRPHGHRKIERRDHADGPQRMPLLHHPVARALGGDRQAVELPRQADGEVADVDHLLHFALAFRADLAHLERDEVAERLLVLPQRIAEIAHELAALGRRALAPRLERPLRRGDDGVGRRARRLTDGRDRLAGRRVDRHEQRGVGLDDPSVRSRARAGVDLLDLKFLQERLNIGRRTARRRRLDHSGLHDSTRR